MNRGYLALGGALVLAAVIGLYAVLSRGDDRAVTPAPRDPEIAQASPGKPSGSGPARTPSANVTPEQTTPSTTTTKEYTVGGVRIRDHRSGAHVQPDVPPAIHPPGGRKVPSELTSGIAQKVRAVVAECAASVPAEARGEKPRADGEIRIAIKSQQATVTGATIQMRDVVGAAGDPVKQCIEQKAIGVATPSGDEADLEDYAITVSFRLP